MIERLQNIFNDVVGRTEIILTPDTKIDESAGITSLAKIRLICAIEDDFNIEVSNKALKSFKKVADVIKYLEKNA